MKDRRHNCPPAIIRGFTLIELLVVLALLGVISGIAVPKLWNQLERAQQRHAIEKIWLRSFQDIKSILKQGNAVELNEGFMVNQMTIAGITDWQISVPTPIVYRPHHVTTGGEIVFMIDSSTHWQLAISRLDGQIDLQKL
ncbi:prepilin-type N-terminal cleavage/methylation domain-containing protein [Motilimonas sp. KMU-193]|uniref:prepilin-type N-terminal cleavage/methylation domain-containing protein n=1 Tax=Motilimonas sp. KMU-193 TaxID=3388668 RepID=UPI00396AFFFA